MIVRKLFSPRFLKLKSFSAVTTVTFTNQVSLSREDHLKSPFRCVEKNPLNHNINHEALFYTISSDDYNRIFTFGGLTPEFRKKIKTFSEFSIMARKPALDVINCLRNINFDFPTNRFLLYGVKGSGKTVTLAHILHFISYQKWLILHIPWPALLIRLYKEVTPSSYKSGRYDHPLDAVTWLQQFKLQNVTLLQELQLKILNSYTWTSREQTEKGSLLTDLIEQGINRPKFSSDCVGAVVKEIKLLANSKQVRAAVIIDGVNSFFHTTRLRREDRSPVPPEDVTLIHAFTKLISPDWTNGVVIASADLIAMPGDMRESHLPRYLLGKKGFQHFDPFIPIHVENYTVKEINSCLDYYADRKWIQSEKGKSEDGRQQLMFLSGHNPQRLLELCGPW